MPYINTTCCTFITSHCTQPNITLVGLPDGHGKMNLDINKCIAWLMHFCLAIWSCICGKKVVSNKARISSTSCWTSSRSSSRRRTRDTRMARWGTTCKVLVHQKRLNWISACHDCFECGEIFPNKSELQVHLLIVHYDFCLHQGHEQSCGRQFSHQCFECKKGFPSKHGLMVHQRSCGSFECFECEAIFYSSKMLKCHMFSDYKTT